MCVGAVSAEAEECILELGLQVVVSNPAHVGAGSLTQGVCKAEHAHTQLLSQVSTTLLPEFLNKEKCWLEAGHMTNTPSLHV